MPAETTARPLSAADELARLRAELAATKAKLEKKTAISLKVSEKGAVSMYGVGRFPVTLYREQWETVLANADKIRAFIAANKARLKTKE